MEQLKLGDFIVVRKKIHNAILKDSGLITAIGYDTYGLVKYQRIICGNSVYKLEPKKLENNQLKIYVDEIWRRESLDTMKRIWVRDEAEIIKQNTEKNEEE